jgi:NADPH-dependent 2,4-dienoyl-CoA reductase/sulfur reductase-like enzyme
LRRKQPDWPITVISGESDHHYSRPALMYVFMGHMRYEDAKPYEDHVWREQRIDLVRDWVTRVDIPNRLVCFDGPRQAMPWDNLLIATGSQANRFGWPGQDLDGVQSLYGLGDLELLERNVSGTTNAVIVGGGLIGIELAEMLHSRGIRVTFLIRETEFWNVILPAEEAAMISRLIEAAGLGLVRDTVLERIVDDGTGRVTGVTTGAGDRIDCQLVGLTAGVSPNIDLARDSGIPTGRGVLVDWSMRAQQDGVFAAGDCAEVVTGTGKNLVQPVWYTGREQGRVAADVMAGEECLYDPGIWFNSAKFLDTEYQVYGDIGVGQVGLPGRRDLFWKRDDGRMSVRIVYTQEGVAGFNLIGVRYRHEVCERWIREQRPVAYVLDHLGEASFDPEFHRKYETEIAGSFRKQIADST